MKTEAETVNFDEKMRQNETEKLLKTESFFQKNHLLYHI